MKNKIKIMKHPPTISDEEIERYMNFNQILSERSRVLKWRSLFTKGILTTVGLSLVAVFYWMSIQPDTNTAATSQISQPDSLNEIVKPSYGEENAIPHEIDIASGRPEKSSMQPLTKEGSSKDEVDSITDLEEVPVRKLPNVVYEYKEAEPKLGYNHLYEYLSTNLSYPKDGIQDSIQGVVQVAFSIDATGRPIDIQVERSLGISFDKEVIRLIETMPEWTPAMMNGKPVKSRLSLPLTFELKTKTLEP